jgi:prophage regulatory protein
MAKNIQFVRLSTLKQLTGLSRSSIYARLNPGSASYDPTFPRQVKLSPGPRGAAAWSLAEVEVWLMARLEARPAQAS